MASVVPWCSQQKRSGKVLSYLCGSERLMLFFDYKTDPRNLLNIHASTCISHIMYYILDIFVCVYVIMFTGCAEGERTHTSSVHVLPAVSPFLPGMEQVETDMKGMALQQQPKRSSRSAQVPLSCHANPVPCTRKMHFRTSTAVERNPQVGKIQGSQNMPRCYHWLPTKSWSLWPFHNGNGISGTESKSRIIIAKHYQTWWILDVYFDIHDHGVIDIG